MKFKLNNPESQKRTQKQEEQEREAHSIAFHIIMHLVDTSGFTICIIFLSGFHTLLDFPRCLSVSENETFLIIDTVN